MGIAPEPPDRAGPPREPRPTEPASDPERPEPAPPSALTPFQRAFAGAVVGVLYALGSIARGHVAAGLVGGALAAILCALVLKRYAERRR